ncbi:hypothetical protein IWQ60_003186 [Tieghemiomyces parasiticus]|uniref:Uncharacterized protein n=1 Tax=Tieghemiomyces parasiticus TaxID=78921 RepID=A0A9W8AG10_9FUNG|nr:hypothetical protein IWQ60_003186 [Tieghemiomyces parasiticus]
MSSEILAAPATRTNVAALPPALLTYFTTTLATPSSSSPATSNAAPLERIQTVGAHQIADPQLRAERAGLARLISCLANERLVRVDLVTLPCVEPAAGPEAQGSRQRLHRLVMVIRQPDTPAESSVTSEAKVTGSTSATEVETEKLYGVGPAEAVFYLGALHRPITDASQPLVPTKTTTVPAGCEVTSSRVTFLDPEECGSPLYLGSLLDPNADLKVVRQADTLMAYVAAWNRFETDIVREICREMTNSMVNQAHVYAHRPAIPNLSSSALAWENSIIEGHATHPMNKARYAIPPLEPLAIGEDLSHPTVLFATAPRAELQVRGPFEALLAPLLNRAGLNPADRAAADEEDRIVFPIHERQLPNIVSRFPYVRILPVTTTAVAQASLRTVVPNAHPDINLKLPLGIKVSSALRTITPWTTYLGPGLRPVLQRILPSSDDVPSDDGQRPCLVVAHETASVVARHPDSDVAKHLSALIREDAATLVRPLGERVAVCAALTEYGPDGVPYVVSAWGLHTQPQRLDFLDRYVTLYLRAFLPPVVRHGFTFEAHQQNVLVRYSPEQAGRVVGFVVRDFGGIKVHQPTLMATTAPDHIQMDAIPDGSAEAHHLEDVYDLAYHTMFQMNLHRLIRALGLHYNGQGWAVVRRILRAQLDALEAQENEREGGELKYAANLRQRWLGATEVSYKCFITMKVDGLYRDYIYTNVPNLLLYVDEAVGVSLNAV